MDNTATRNRLASPRSHCCCQRSCNRARPLPSSVLHNGSNRLLHLIHTLDIPSVPFRNILTALFPPEFEFYRSRSTCNIGPLGRNQERTDDDPEMYGNWNNRIIRQASFPHESNPHPSFDSCLCSLILLCVVRWSKQRKRFQRYHYRVLQLMFEVAVSLWWWDIAAIRFRKWMTKWCDNMQMLRKRTVSPSRRGTFGESHSQQFRCNNRDCNYIDCHWMLRWASWDRHILWFSVMDMKREETRNQITTVAGALGGTELELRRFLKKKKEGATETSLEKLRKISRRKI